MGVEKCCNQVPRMLSSDTVNPCVYINTYQCDECHKIHKYRVIIPWGTLKGDETNSEFIKIGDKICITE